MPASADRDLLLRLFDAAVAAVSPAKCLPPHVAEYFRAKGVRPSDPPFFDRMALRFGTADRAAHCHVPLYTPWSYGTYRGS
jgi:5-hydroxyisourate hydrolase-like protein (transthyretin family)